MMPSIFYPETAKGGEAYESDCKTPVKKVSVQAQLWIETKPNMLWIYSFAGVRSNNLLCPVESRERRIFLYVCLTCRHQEKVQFSMYEQAQLFEDAYPNAALPRAWGTKCPVCDHPEVVFFLDTTGEGLALNFACCKQSCGQNFRERVGDSC